MGINYMGSQGQTERAVALQEEEEVSHSENHISAQKVSSSDTEITLELCVICKSEHRIKSKDCNCVSLSCDGGSVAEVTGGEVDGRRSFNCVI